MMISYIVIFLGFTFPFTVHSQGVMLIGIRKFDLPGNSKGPRATALDAAGIPYMGISDGRVLQYDFGKTQTLLDRYITSPNRTSSECDGTDDPDRLGLICGRPLGLGFYSKERKFYIADAFRGLLVVRAEDTLAVPVAANNILRGTLAYGLDVDQQTGDVYYTIASSRFNLSQLQTTALAANDATGKLVKYNRNTDQVTVLLNSLSGPRGVALSSDRSYVLVTEYITRTVRKYWLTGSKAFTSEQIVMFSTARPDSIKRTAIGDFWVAVNDIRPNGITHPLEYRINDFGRVLSIFNLTRFYVNTTVSEFLERTATNQYYVGSLDADFYAIIN